MSLSDECWEFHSSELSPIKAARKLLYGVKHYDNCDWGYPRELLDRLYLYIDNVLKKKDTQSIFKLGRLCLRVQWFYDQSPGPGGGVWKTWDPDIHYNEAMHYFPYVINAMRLDLDEEYYHPRDQNF